MLDRTTIKNTLNRIFEQLLPLLAVPLALVVGAFILLALKVNPLQAYGALVEGIVGSVFGLTQTLVQATPLLLVALGIVIAFRGGVLNIGGEGQITVGALATTAVALALPGLPALVLAPLCILAGALSDRIAVIYEGKIIGIVDGPSATLEQLGLMMAGVREESV